MADVTVENSNIRRPPGVLTGMPKKLRLDVGWQDRERLEKIAEVDGACPGKLDLLLHVSVEGGRRDFESHILNGARRSISMELDA